MALKKLKLPDNTVVEIQDTRVVSDGIVYIGDAIDPTTYTDGGSTVSLTDYAKKTWVQSQGYLTEHQSLKTINNQSLIGTGNINISGGGGGGGGDENVIETIKVNGTALTPDANKAVDITVPAALSDLTDDATHRLVTDTEKSAWNDKVSNVQADWDASSGLAAILNKPSIPAEVTESTVSGWGFTKNAGTLTGVTYNGNNVTVNNGIAAITAPSIIISSSEPTAAQGKNGDIWFVV